jgi:hypothetical protein
MGSQARAANPLLSPPPAGATQRPSSPGLPAQIPMGSQARAKNPLGVPGAPSPSGSLPRPVAAPAPQLQPSGDKTTDKRMALSSPAATTADDEAMEVSDDEIQSLSDTGEDEPLDAPAQDPSSTLSNLDDEEPPEAEAEAELDESDSRDLEPSSMLDPWFAQLVHGWCPPAADLFSRLPPPTTFPGRENPPS